MYQLILPLGITLLLLAFFQLASGLRWIKPHPRWHRRLGIALAILALAHGAIAIYYSFF